MKKCAKDLTNVRTKLCEASSSVLNWEDVVGILQNGNMPRHVNRRGESILSKFL